MSGLRLILVRHGETAANVDKLLDSLPPGPPLNETGRRQALEVCGALRGEPIVAIHASTALRAQQTAAPLAAQLGLPVQVVDGAQEVAIGDYEMRGDETALRGFFDVLREWNRGNLAAALPGGESAAEAVLRFTATVGEICAPHHDGTVVLFAHGAIIQLGATALAKNVPLEATGPGHVPNAGRVLLEADGDGWYCVEWTGGAFDPGSA